jgi:hypothetical protein
MFLFGSLFKPKNLTYFFWPIPGCGKSKGDDGAQSGKSPARRSAKIEYQKRFDFSGANNFLIFFDFFILFLLVKQINTAGAIREDDVINDDDEKENKG